MIRKLPGFFLSQSIQRDVVFIAPEAKLQHPKESLDMDHVGHSLSLLRSILEFLIIACSGENLPLPIYSA